MSRPGVPTRRSKPSVDSSSVTETPPVIPSPSKENEAVPTPFISELYEIAQAPFLSRAILSVFIRPRAPTFNVTAKSETLERSFVSHLGRPLLILFGLNMADELDRSAFTVLLPEIREDFGLGTQGILGVVAVAGAAALLLTVPIAQAADRSNRVRLALLGALSSGALAARSN